MKLINATELDRKSGVGGSKRDLHFILPSKRMQFTIFHLPFGIPFKKANWICPHSGTPDANGSL
jgi:hypothetical protein